MSMLCEMIEHAESNADAASNPVDAGFFEESADLFKLVFATCAALNMPPPSKKQGRPPGTFIPPTKKRRGPRHQRDYSQSSWGALYMSEHARAQLVLPGSKAAKKFRRRSVLLSSSLGLFTYRPSFFISITPTPLFQSALFFFVHTNPHCVRFRIPYAFFAEMIVDLRSRPDQQWVQKHDKTDAAGRKAAPLELLVLSAFRILGRAFTFDDCEESTNISQETIRVFFHAFCEFFGTVKYDEEVKGISTTEEAEECEEVCAQTSY